MEMMNTVRKEHEHVSVPYRGATFLNRLESNSEVTEEFPSPIGELHFSIRKKISKTQLRSFRPLSGSYISQSQKTIDS